MLASRAWSCESLHKGASYTLNQGVKVEEGQSLEHRVGDMDREQLQQQLLDTLQQEVIQQFVNLNHMKYTC